MMKQFLINIYHKAKRILGQAQNLCLDVILITIITVESKIYDVYPLYVFLLSFIVLYLIYNFFRWILNRPLFDKLKSPPKRFTTNESSDICRVDTKRIPEMIKWVNELENELENQGYYDNPKVKNKVK